MCDVCHNITGINCPVCTPTDRSEPEEIEQEIPTDPKASPIDELVFNAIKKLEDQQADNIYKYAYITGYLSACLRTALNGDTQNVINKLKSL